MAQRLLVAAILSVVIVCMCGFLFVLFSMMMTGSDLRNPIDMLIYVAGVVVIVCIGLVPLVLVWRWALQ